MIAVGPGIKQTVTERGPWTHHRFTACRFAVEAQIDLRMGYQVSVDPSAPTNFVADLQKAGDPTPGDGSTMRQGQKAQAALLPDSPMLFGTLSDAEMFDAVNRGATVGFAVNCGKLPRALKNFVGYGYNGGHYMAVDWTDGTLVDLSDPMYRPAKDAKPRRVPWADIKDAIVRNGAGEMIVTLGFQDAANLPGQLASVQSQIAAAQATLGTLQSEAASIQARLDAIAA